VTLRYRDYTSYLCFAISLGTFLWFSFLLGKRGVFHAREAIARWRAAGLFDVEKDGTPS
jgi:hypothetical protein